MANNPTTPNMIKEIIRLRQEGHSKSKISRATGISRPTIIKYVDLVEASGFALEELQAFSEEELHQLFHLTAPELPIETNKIYNNLCTYFEYAENELRKTGVTRKLLWEEYLQKHPDGVMYSQFCHHLKAFLNRDDAYMPIHHKTGDKLYIDFAGKRFSIVDPISGEIIPKECFVATLGASQYTYVQACDSQKSNDFIEAIENAFLFFGGVPACVVIDNLKSGVIKASKYEPLINERLAGLAAHYGTVIMPTRPRKPKDKSLVEGAVSIAYRRIHAPLRNDVFTSTQELNQAIRHKLLDYNKTLFQGKEYGREHLFLQVEKQALKPLATERYELKEYLRLKVQKNCHVNSTKDKVHYSVPYQYKGKYVKVVLGHSHVEIYHNYKRIAFHKRCKRPYQYVTQQEHMPSSHRFIHQMEPSILFTRAERIGTQTKQYIEKVLEVHTYPEQGYKSCEGILSFAKKYTPERLESACNRASEYQAFNYRTIKNILEKGLDQQQGSKQIKLNIPEHDNIRANYQ